MAKRLRLSLLLALALLLASCTLPAPTGEPTPGATVTEPASTETVPPSETPVPSTSIPTATDVVETVSVTVISTPSAWPSATPTATLAPTSMPAPTASATPGPLFAPNLFTNGGFESDVRPVGFGEVNVFEGWWPFYCDEPYTPHKCPAYLINAGNPPGLLMGRPEYKPIYKRSPFSGFNAQQWFCYYRTCVAGVFQTVETTPGMQCEAGAYVQSWSNYDGDLASELDSESDRANSRWFMKVDPEGGQFAFLSQNMPPDLDGDFASGLWGYDQGIYDRWTRIAIEFRAQTSRTTVFFGDARLWPFENNDSYLDAAWLICWPPGTPKPQVEPDVATPPPTPAGTPTPAATPTRIFACDYGADVEANHWFFRSGYPLNVRSAPRRAADTYTGKTLYAGTLAPVVCLYAASETDRWVYVNTGTLAGWVAVSLDLDGDGLGEIFGEIVE